MKDVIELRNQVETVRSVYENLLQTGQAENWACDQRTKDLWCLSHFIDDRFYDCPEVYRKDLGWAFNRMVRSAEDPFDVALVVIFVGDNRLNVDDYTKDYWTAKNHNKWH